WQRSPPRIPFRVALDTDRSQIAHSNPSRRSAPVPQNRGYLFRPWFRGPWFRGVLLDETRTCVGFATALLFDQSGKRSCSGGGLLRFFLPAIGNEQLSINGFLCGIESASPFEKRHRLVNAILVKM